MNNSVIGLKNPGWELNKSRYSEIDDLPLMATLGPVLIILALYLVFVLKVGPAFMRKRDAYKLTFVMLVYNGVQVAISAYLVARYFLNLLEMGMAPKFCYMDENAARSKILIGTYLYFGAKLTELLDTVFFVLRKKENQISFLHLYHHSIMVIGTWAMLKYWPSHTLIFIGFLNSLVHVFMYTYYGLAALGPNVAKYLTWKKYMTKFQLIQFVSIIIQYVITVRVSDCPPSRGVAIFVSCNTAFILILFLNFYWQNYINRKAKTLKRDAIHKNTVSARSNGNIVDHLNGITKSYEGNVLNGTTAHGVCKLDDFAKSNGEVLYNEAGLSNGTDKDTTLTNGTDISNFIAEISSPNRKYSLKND